LLFLCLNFLSFEIEIVKVEELEIDAIDVKRVERCKDKNLEKDLNIKICICKIEKHGS